jgi:hypothetical protein
MGRANRVFVNALGVLLPLIVKRSMNSRRAPIDRGDLKDATGYTEARKEKLRGYSSNGGFSQESPFAIIQ